MFWIVDVGISKSAVKQRKRREARKAKNVADAKEHDESTFVSPVDIKLTGDPETDKKVKNIKKVHLYLIFFRSYDALLYVELRVGLTIQK